MRAFRLPQLWNNVIKYFLLSSVLPGLSSEGKKKIIFWISCFNAYYLTGFHPVVCFLNIFWFFFSTFLFQWWSQCSICLFVAGEARAPLTAFDQVFLDQWKEKVQYLGLANTTGQLVSYVIIHIAFFLILSSWLILQKATRNRRYYT